jgi:hypothetical protein
VTNERRASGVGGTAGFEGMVVVVVAVEVEFATVPSPFQLNAASEGVGRQRKATAFEAVSIPLSQPPSRLIEFLFLFLNPLLSTPYLSD